MTSAQVVETSVTNNSSFQNYLHPDDHTIRTSKFLINFCDFMLWLVGKGWVVSAERFFPLFFFSVCPIPRFSNPWHISFRPAHKRSVGRGPGSTALLHDKKCDKTKATSTNLSWQRYGNHATLGQSNCPICNQSEYTVSCRSKCTSFFSQSQHSLSSQPGSTLPNKLGSELFVSSSHTCLN